MDAGTGGQDVTAPVCTIVPPYLLEHIAGLQAPGPASVQLSHAPSAAASTLRNLGARRPQGAFRPQGPPAAPQAGRTDAVVDQQTPAIGLSRTVADAENLEELPGRTVRSEGGPATNDPAVDEAYDGLGDTHALFHEAYGRNSIDGSGGPLNASVHYGRNYDNAFWNGSRMVFGDGDGEVFQRFTRSRTVIGHELTHGLIQYETPLTYQGQPGALQESIADIFGVLVEQYALRQQATEASWLIGAELFTDQVEGKALRSLKAPGTAYNDDVLGKDPQPATMAAYVETSADNGGVHINSGIPNHAFYLLAETLGGFAWERAGQLWYDAVISRGIPADCDFAQFARITVDTAQNHYGEGTPEHAAVLAAWQETGVLQ